MSRAYMIIDGQWGSTGKGLLAGYLAIKRGPDLVVCNFGPNAGHTCIIDVPEINGLAGTENYPIMTQQLPTGAVVLHKLGRPVPMLIGPGSIIDVDIFLGEMKKFNVPANLVFIHEHAATVSKEDKEAEASGTKHIASTMKGTGAAIQRKIARTSINVTAQVDPRLSPMVITRDEYAATIHRAETIQIETAQGFDLSLNHGTKYPFVTSRDITPEAALNDVAVPMRRLGEVCVSLRTYPIRVGNVIENGVEVGNSGPYYKDQRELTWEEMAQLAPQVGLLPEKTTVTGRIRRIFTWSDAQFNRMLEAYSPCSFFLNFCNYLSVVDQLKLMGKINAMGNGQNVVWWTGHGPHVNDVVANLTSNWSSKKR